MRQRFLIFWLACLVVALGGFAAPVQALEPISVPPDVRALDLSNLIDSRREGTGDRIQVSTAPGSDGIVRRIEVRAQETGTTPYWLVFALANNSDHQIDRLLTAPFFRLSGSGLFWPDLGASRIVTITPSQGFAPEREPSSEADVFRITLDPGSVVTFVAELRTSRVPQVYLWEPDAYKDNVNAYTFYQGAVLGIAGLLALLLTVLFLVRGTASFPAAAIMGWSVLFYLAVDFGLANLAFGVQPGEDQFARASAELAVAGSIIIFLFTYLSLHRWHSNYVYVTSLWLACLAAVIVTGIFNPQVAAGIARSSFALSVVFGVGVIVYLSLNEFDRAINLIPTWILLSVWLFCASLTVTGGLANDAVQPALNGGLVLIVLLIAFTVIQHAFSGAAVPLGQHSEVEQKALAMTGAGHIVWDWDVTRDKIFTGFGAEAALGHPEKALSGPAREWLTYIHPNEQERFSMALDGLIDLRRGRISQDFRLRAEDGNYRTFQLKARPVVGADGEVVRCIGSVQDVTEARLAEERLLRDAVKDSLTGLPNMELFKDRLNAIVTLANHEETAHPVVILIDIDRFRRINKEVSVAAGDSVLLNASRRMARLIRPQDTLARLSGDRFGIILMSGTDPQQVQTLAENLRQAVRAPVSFAGNNLSVTISVGYVAHDFIRRQPDELYEDAELALLHAKRLGGDRAEGFRAALRKHTASANELESELASALKAGQITVRYQPIVRLQDSAIAGFEARLRWNHPVRGPIAADDFVPIAERNGMILQLGYFAMEQAAKDLADWHRLSGMTHLFVNVNCSSKQLIRQDLIGDVKAVLSRTNLTPSALRLELAEALIMENPEHSNRVIKRIKQMNVSLVLDEFGTGYSSLSQLEQLPFDSLKIDQSFVRPAGRSGRSAILRSIINLAHDLNLEIIAQGAETDSDALELLQMGCQYAQGTLYGDPRTAAEVRVMLTRHQNQPVAAQ